MQGDDSADEELREWRQFDSGGADEPALEDLIEAACRFGHAVEGDHFETYNSAGGLDAGDSPSQGSAPARTVDDRRDRRSA